MRAVIQRVSSASVRVDGEVVGEIDHGLLVLLGVAIMSGSVTPYLVLPVFVLVITRRYIRMEEANLTRQFGDDYLAYTKRVRRWI